MTLEERARELLGGRIMNLVFEGGGVWGIAYEGALAELAACDVLPGVERVAGASAGAIVACLLAVGTTPQELGEILRTTDFRAFTDQDFGYARDTARLLTEYGWYKGDAFREWIKQAIHQRSKALSEELGIEPPGGRATLAELAAWQDKARAKGRKLPRLYLVGSNLSRQCREVYSHEGSEAAKLRVMDAVRRSMSIPLFFACARGDQKDVIVDGGLTWNYPVNLFDHRDYLADPANGHEVSYSAAEGFVFNAETLGFRLDTTKELQLNLKDWRNEPFKIDNVVHYGWALVAFIRAIANKVHLHQNDWSRTIFIDVGEKIGFTDFDLEEPDKDSLSTAGRAGVRTFLEWRVSNKGLAELEKIYGKL